MSQSTYERTEPRVSKSGTTKFTFWEETPLAIRYAIETKGNKNVTVEGFEQYTFSAKPNSSGSQTVFWNPAEEPITGQQLPDKPKRFTKAGQTNFQLGKPTANDWAERDEKKNAQIQKLHDERVAATNAQTEAITKLAEAINYQTTMYQNRFTKMMEGYDKCLDTNNEENKQIGNLTRQLEDLCFLLGEQNKVGGKK